MKRNNFFISLLICLGLMFAVSSCKDKEEPFIPVDCPPNVIICAETFNDTPKVPETPELPISISDVRIEGDYLKMTISASGCDGSSWVVKIVTDGTIIRPIPARPLRIIFENNEDCEAMIRREFSFNIECLRVPNINKMWFQILGTEYSVPYEW